jgi:hypothetical protein
MEAPQQRSADELVRLVRTDPQRLEALKSNPLQELEKLRDEAVDRTAPIYFWDRWVYRIVVITLGLVVLVAAVGSIILVMSGKTTPEALVALGSAAVGALAGLLAPSPTGK